MSGIIDTNLLLYAANGDCEEYMASRKFLTGLLEAPGQCYLTEGICYEFLRVSTHHKVFPRPLKAAKAMTFLGALLNRSGITVLSAGTNHWRMLEQVLAEMPAMAGNLCFDLRTVVLMREYGIATIYTADTDFLQFQGIQVINPLVAPKR